MSNSTPSTLLKDALGALFRTTIPDVSKRGPKVTEQVAAKAVVVRGLTHDKSGSYWRTHAVEPSQRHIRILFCELQRRLSVLPADAHHAASAALIRKRL